MADYFDVLTGVTEDAGYKAPCRVATTADMGTALTGLPIIDGIQLVDQDRVLVWKQSDPTTNGIYVAQSGAWSRSVDFSSSVNVLRGTQTYVSDGTLNGGGAFICQTSLPSFSNSWIPFSTIAPSPATFGQITRAVAVVTAFSLQQQTVQVSGLTAIGDGGQGTYVRLSGAPSSVTAAHFQSADGAWWELATEDLYPQQVAAVGTSNDTASLHLADLAAVALGIDLVINRNHNVGSAINFASHVRFTGVGKLKAATSGLITFSASVTASPSHYWLDNSLLTGGTGAGLSGLAAAKLRIDFLTPQHCGASIGQPDSGPYLDSWFSSVCLGLCEGRFLGSLVCGRNLNWDVTIGLAYAKGLKIRGSSNQDDGISFSTGFGLTLTALTPVGGNPASIFYYAFEDFFLNGSVSSGALVTLGDAAFTHALNAVRLKRITINNSAQNVITRGASIGVQVNYVLFSVFELVIVNCGGSGNPYYATAPGYGIGWQIRQSISNQFNSCGAGNCNLAHQYIDGTSHSNVHINVDIEEAYIGIQVDTTKAFNNKYIGGAIVANFCFNENVLAMPRMSVTALCNPYTYGNFGDYYTYTGTFTDGLPTVTGLSSTTGLVVDMGVTAPTLPVVVAPTFLVTQISVINGSTLTLSRNSVGGGLQTLTFLKAGIFKAFLGGIMTPMSGNQSGSWVFATPTLPASASTYTNNSPHHWRIHYGGGTSSAFTITSVGQSPQGVPGSLSGFSFDLYPGDAFTPTYSVTPGFQVFYVD